jgi:hypothetical protein
MSTLTAAQTEAIYESTHPALEQQELCGDEFSEALVEAINADGGEPAPEWKQLEVETKRGQTSGLVGNGRILKEIKGMGTVYDWRDSDWTPVNGGRFGVRGFTHHIPVIRNVDGIGDIVTLRNVLVAQNLMVQTCTDREGNVGLFAPFDILCYHNRGGNQLFTGCEHMHYLASEDWTKRQLRAWAWLIQLCERKHDVIRTRWRLGYGDGVCRVLEEGQGWHSEVSRYAGYNDRSDPWGSTPHDVVVERWEYIQSCIKYFELHGHFEGA